MSKHSCSSLVIRCIDFRIAPSKLTDLLAQAGVCQDGDYDLVSVAGAGKDLLSDNKAERDFILKQINISKNLHDIKTIYILMHDNCGAYNIADAATEDQVQSDDLCRLIIDLKKIVPGVEVKGYIIKGVPNQTLSLTPVE